MSSHDALDGPGVGGCGGDGVRRPGDSGDARADVERGDATEGGVRDLEDLDGVLAGDGEEVAGVGCGAGADGVDGRRVLVLEVHGRVGFDLTHNT